jgi:hypothetical protein
MKKTFVFKLLIDLVYYYFFAGMVSILVIFPFIYLFIKEGKIQLEGIETSLSSLTFTHWIIILLGLIAYALFFKGLYHLRTVARFLLSQNFFSIKTIQNLNTSGTYFLYSSILYFIILIVSSISKIFKGHISMSFNTTTTLPIFIAIIGLFFILQSKALQIARVYKDDNALTI